MTVRAPARSVLPNFPISKLFRTRMRKSQDQEQTVRTWSVVLVLAAVVLLARVDGQQRDKDQSRGRPDDFVQGELLVKFNRTLNHQQREALLSGKRFGVIRRFDALDIELVRVPPGLAVAVAAGGLRALSGIVTVQPNYLRYAVQSAPPNDRFWLEGRLWALDRIQAPSVWNTFSRGDDRVVVASLDTGINYTHPDLAPNMWRNPLEIPGNGIDDDNNGYVDDVFGIDTRKHNGDPLDDQGHGTLTAGTIAAAGNNDEGIVGVSWNAKLLACKFMDADGVGTDAGAIECFNYIVAMRNRGVNIRVSSNGWGADRNDAAPAGALKAAIETAGAAGILNVFGAGNGGDNTDRDAFDPASLDSSGSLSVASSDRGDGKSRFSNYGGRSVDLAAPGEDILTTYRNAYASASGTSMAAAHVAGAAALIAGLDPTLSPEGIKVLLLRNVDQLPQWNGRVASGGRLNVFRAASAVGVSPNKPPSVSIKSPVDGDVLTMPVHVTIDAVANDDPAGTVKQVAFFANGTLVGTAAGAPFSVPWSPAVGTYTLTAVATDNLDAANTSAGVSVTVAKPNVPPTVSLTSPVGGASFVAPATIPLSATAADADGSVSSVTFYANGAPIGVDSASPFELSWSPVAAGDYTVTAMATDNKGATTTSAGVTVTVAKPNVPPTVSLTSPIAGASFVAPATIPLSALASDEDGSVASVTFYANGAPIGVDSASPFELSWSPVAAGDYTVTAVAMDNKGATTTSAGVPVTVAKPNVPPAVSLTSPGAGSSFLAPATIPLSALASDEDGSVSSVTFYANGLPIGADATSPFAIAWGPVAPGQYTLTAVATDNKNATTTSMSVSIVVVAPNVPPTVALTAPAFGASFVAPVSITVTASAADADGSVTSVTFFVDGVPVSSDSSSPYSFLWSNVQPGTYTLTASATDNAGATSASNAVTVTVTAPLRLNQALAANGGVASASSTLSAAYPPSGAINGDRRGLNWGAGGGWNDGTLNAGPDWLAIAFNGAKTIDEVSVFSMQDTFNAPLEPTPTMTFTTWGLRAFEIQYWDGANWVPIPGASVANNNLVWRRFTFTPVTTTAIRVFVTAALNGSSRVMEVEAWGTDAFGSVAEPLSGLGAEPPLEGVHGPAVDDAFARNAGEPGVRDRRFGEDAAATYRARRCRARIDSRHRARARRAVIEILPRGIAVDLNGHAAASPLREHPSQSATTPARVPEIRPRGCARMCTRACSIAAQHALGLILGLAQFGVWRRQDDIELRAPPPRTCRSCRRPRCSPRCP